MTLIKNAITNTSTTTCQHLMENMIVDVTAMYDFLKYQK